MTHWCMSQISLCSHDSERATCSRRRDGSRNFIVGIIAMVCSLEAQSPSKSLGFLESTKGNSPWLCHSENIIISHKIKRCDRCEAMDEDPMHTLVSCSHTKNDWVAAREELDVKLSRLCLDTWTKDIVLDKRFSYSDRNKIITVMHPI